MIASFKVCAFGGLVKRGLLQLVRQLQLMIILDYIRGN